MSIRPTSWRLHGMFMILGLASGVVGKALAVDADDLFRRASWQPPSVMEARDMLFGWLESQQTDAAVRTEIEQSWKNSENWPPDVVLEHLTESIARIDSRAEQLYAFCREPRPAYELPGFAILSDEQLPTWLRANLALFYAKWLAAQQLFDEASEILSPISTAEVVDPAGLLFFKSVTAHRRLEKDQCLAALHQLLENESQLPQRYLVVARLMQSDIEPLREDSLDEVSRIMNNIHVRLGHGRAGTRVREEEEDVISKLDKLIEKLEEQANSASAAAAAGGTNGPSSPMEDSMPAGGSGPGNVDAKRLGAETDWGNLPPKEREEALQQLGRDLPSHYRSVIEEYFRKLAREDDES